MEKHHAGLNQKITRLIEEEKRQSPSPFLASKIEDALFNKEQQAPLFIFRPAFQTILSGMIILLCAYLGFAVVNDNATAIPTTEKKIYFNEMKMEPLENRLLK